MTSPLRRAAVALAMWALLLAAASPATAGATSLPEAGPLSRGYVEALHNPLVTAGLGHVPSPVEVHVGVAAKARAARLVTEPAFSLVDLGRVTPVKNQGSYSTCWAFASIAALESQLLPGETWDFSEDNLVGRSGFGSSAAWRYSWGGYDFMAIAYLTRWDGPVAEANDPYPSPTPPRVNLVRKHVQGVIMIPGRISSFDNDLIKQLVIEHGAVSVGMYWDDTAYNAYESNPQAAHAAFYLAGALGENHGVDVVGWDDNFAASNFSGADGTPPGDGAFLVRNSWGSGFGENGYFWVSYHDGSFARDQGLDYGGCTAYSRIGGVRNYTYNYQYDALGLTDHWGYDGAEAWAANRFTATSNKSIAAAGFYALSANTAYEVWAGSSLKQLRLRASGTAALPGFSTVAFDTPCAAKKGRKFVVAVRLISPGETYPVAVERPADTWQSGATARAGQSFMSSDGVAWTDLHGVDALANVCLKAYAR